MSIPKVLIVTAVLCLVFPRQSPAPLIYQPGEGWTYQGASDIMDNPKDQLELGKRYESKKQWDDAIASYLYLLRKWPRSDQAPEAQYRLAICHEDMANWEKAFKSYQRCLKKFPSHPNFDDILEREFKIGNLFLAGERQKIWKLKTMPSMDVAVRVYEGLIESGPQSKWAPQAQFNIGLAREKQRHYSEAIAAYQKLIDRYPDHDLVEAAYYQIGVASGRAAQRAEYDQAAADKATESFQEYLARYPKGVKAGDAGKSLEKVRTEQARGVYLIARFYQKQKKDQAALIYYNDLLNRFPESIYAKQAKEFIAKATATPRNR